MREHELKTWPSEFDALKSGAKTFEVRDSRDRDFAQGDVLVLRKFSPGDAMYAGPHEDGREWLSTEPADADTLRMRVTYILHGGRFGLQPGMCVMAVVPESAP